MSDGIHDDRWTEEDERQRSESRRQMTKAIHREYCRTHGHSPLLGTPSICSLCGGDTAK